MTARPENLSVADLGRALRRGDVTSEAVTHALFERIRTLNPLVHAFVTPTEDRALADARRADAELRAGRDRGPMHGIPYGLKDLYDTAGIRTTCCSKLRLDIVPETDSEVGRRLHEAGGVLLGKLTTHEFAQGGPSFDLPFPPSRNPWNTDHYTAGSSSGSGAGVAAGMMRVAMGSDTGGSIRSPAALCGLVGLKPTYGRVSRRGVFPLSHSLDHCGPLTRSVEDMAIAMQVIAGHDPLDPASADVAVPDYRAGIEAGVAGLRIGIPRVYMGQLKGGMPGVLAAFARIEGLLRDAGATIVEVALPDYETFVACGHVIMGAEAFSVHANDMRSRPGDYGALMMQRTILGATIPASDYVDAVRLRQRLCDDFDEVWDHCDAMLTTGALATAPPVEAKVRAPWAGSQNITFNVTGSPAMSVPSGLVDGLPATVAIVGRAFDEAMVLRVGRAVEKLSGWLDIPLPMQAKGGN